MSCGFGTAYEALLRVAVSGQDTLLVTGLGPVGMAAAELTGGHGCEATLDCSGSPAGRPSPRRMSPAAHRDGHGPP